jgi:hypothetical protein
VEEVLEAERSARLEAQSANQRAQSAAVQQDQPADHQEDRKKAQQVALEASAGSAAVQVQWSLFHARPFLHPEQPSR